MRNIVGKTRERHTELGIWRWFDDDNNYLLGQALLCPIGHESPPFARRSAHQARARRARYRVRKSYAVYPPRALITHSSQPVCSSKHLLTTLPPRGVPYDATRRCPMETIFRDYCTDHRTERHHLNTQATRSRSTASAAARPGLIPAPRPAPRAGGSLPFSSSSRSELASSSSASTKPNQLICPLAGASQPVPASAHALHAAPKTARSRAASPTLVRVRVRVG